MARTKTKIKTDLIESRDDLFNLWVVREWATVSTENQQKRLFCKLFMGLYDDLTSKFNKAKRDEVFVNFINVVFPTVLDVYKWHESEKARSDIGIVAALDTVSDCEWYIELLTKYSMQYDAKKSGIYFAN